jgi:hypothetical protein
MPAPRSASPRHDHAMVASIPARNLTPGLRGNAPSPNRHLALRASSRKAVRRRAASLRASSHRASSHRASSRRAVERSRHASAPARAIKPCACRAAGLSRVERLAIGASSRLPCARQAIEPSSVERNRPSRMAPSSRREAPWRPRGAGLAEGNGSTLRAAVTGLARRLVRTSSMAPRARPLGSKRNQFDWFRRIADIADRDREGRKWEGKPP